MSETEVSEPLSESPRPAPRTFSAFWPLVILLLTIIGLQIGGIYQTLAQRDQLNANIKQLATVDEEAKRVDTALGAFSRDLLDLATKNPNAQLVVTEFQIRQNSTNEVTPPTN